ncbi:MAG TPA: hypothetical protein DCQ29_12700 [Chitinophagaceae bacterium]|nr:hypothetical protein [Chitinophagaceae bacterium]
MVHPNAYLISKELALKIGGWDISLSPSPDEDAEYFARALINASKIFFTNGFNYYRKVSDYDSLSKKRSLKHAIGAYKTTQTKFDYIFKMQKDEITKELYSNQLANLMYQYAAEYPIIDVMIRQELSSVGITKLKLIEPSVFSFVANQFGFKLAMRLRSIKNLLSNKFMQAIS